MLSRRNLFSVSAAAIIASGPAVSVAAPHGDSELIALGEKHERLLAEHVRANLVADKLYVDYTAQRPEPSDVLIATKADENRFFQRPLKAGEQIDGVTVAYLRDSLPRLENGALFFSGREYLPLSRAKEIIAAHQTLMKEDAAVSRRVGFFQACELADELYDQLSDVENQIKDMPCCTMEGAQIKARIADRHREGLPEYAGEVALSLIDFILNGRSN